MKNRFNENPQDMGWTYHHSEEPVFDYSEDQYYKAPKKRKRFRLLPEKYSYVVNIVLFLITFCTTTYAGSIISGENIDSLRQIFIHGIRFSIPLMLILGVHEMGHFIAAKYYRIKATWPYFIPGPNIIGTFGAVIKMKSPIFFRKALFDIGFAGPAAGFVIALPVFMIGIAKSHLVDMSGVNIEGSIQFGNSILTYFLVKMFHGTIPVGYDIVFHPMAFAGWIGLFVTALNLIPIGQLDGGHIAYSLLGRKQDIIAKILLVVMCCLGFLWFGWLVWAVMIFFIIKTKHPPILDGDVPLDSNRKMLAIITLIVFILIFIPAPFKI